jgi:hypothetical protein
MAKLWFSSPAVLLLIVLGGFAPMAHAPSSAAEWGALSTTAIGITGDVTLDTGRITFDDERNFRIGKLRALSPAEIDGMRDLTGSRNISRANLYRIRIPASTTLRNGNTMCGSAATTRMIAAPVPDRGGKLLILVFLSGSQEPFFQGWRDTADSGICGSFSFIQRH